jgi:hypothetical protein
MWQQVLDINSPMKDNLMAKLLFQGNNIHPACFDLDGVEKLLDAEGNVVNREILTLEAFERKILPSTTVCIGVTDPSLPGANVSTLDEVTERPEKVICSQDAFHKSHQTLLDWAEEGTRVVVLLDTNGVVEIGELRIAIKDMNGVFFVARNADEPVTIDFSPNDFSFW